MDTLNYVWSSSFKVYKILELGHSQLSTMEVILYITLKTALLEFQMFEVVLPTLSAVYPAPAVAWPCLPSPDRIVPLTQQSLLHTPYTFIHTSHTCIYAKFIVLRAICIALFLCRSYSKRLNVKDQEACMETRLDRHLQFIWLCFVQIRCA